MRKLALFFLALYVLLWRAVDSDRVLKLDNDPDQELKKYGSRIDKYIWSTITSRKPRAQYSRL